MRPESKNALCSPFYGRTCRWAILGELKPKGPKGPAFLMGIGIQLLADARQRRKASPRPSYPPSLVCQTVLHVPCSLVRTVVERERDSERERVRETRASARR